MKCITTYIHPVLHRDYKQLMTDEGYETAGKYQIQWNCAATYATEMLVQENSKYKAVICENKDDFEIETIDNQIIGIQVTHVNNNKNFSRRHQKIIKSFRNFLNVLVKNDNVDRFILITNVFVTGMTSDVVKCSDLIVGQDFDYYKKKLETSDDVLKKLLEHTFFKRMDLDFLEDQILELLGDKYDIEYGILKQIRKFIIDSIEFASTKLPKKTLEYEKFRKIDLDDFNTFNTIVQSKRLSKEYFVTQVNQILSQYIQKKESLMMDNGLLLMKQKNIDPENAFAKWKKALNWNLMHYIMILNIVEIMS